MHFQLVDFIRFYCLVGIADQLGFTQIIAFYGEALPIKYVSKASLYTASALLIKPGIVSNMAAEATGCGA
jgi:hypothetical protein